MRLETIDFITDVSNIYLLPSINIIFNEEILWEKNFAIVFNWLMFHARIRWIERRENE